MEDEYTEQPVFARHRHDTHYQVEPWTMGVCVVVLALIIAAEVAGQFTAWRQRRRRR